MAWKASQLSLLPTDTEKGMIEQPHQSTTPQTTSDAYSSPRVTRFGVLFAATKDVLILIALVACIATTGVCYFKQAQQDKEFAAYLKETNAADSTVHRIRRDSNPGSEGSSTAGGSPGISLPAAGPMSGNTHPFVHVTHITADEPLEGDWFSWHTDDEEEYRHLSSALIPVVHNKFIQIDQPGYYMVYSQITYFGSNIVYYDAPTGHELVKVPNCGVGADQILLSSKRTQTPSIETMDGYAPIYPRDSGYVAGVFYFAANDRIGVRPLSTQGRRERRFDTDDMTDSFFGALMLMPDTNARKAYFEDCYRGGSLF